MAMSHLVTMVNDIAAFFAAEEREGHAAEAVVEHLMRYWAPSMRQDLAEHARRGGRNLSPVAREAANRLVERW